MAYLAEMMDFFRWHAGVRISTVESRIFFPLKYWNEDGDMKLLHSKSLTIRLFFFVLSFSLSLLAAEIRVPVYSMPSKLDPITNLDVGSTLIYGQVFDNLYYYNGNNQLLPDLVLSHRISADGKNIRMKIDTRRRFSDGSYLRAQDVVASLQRAILTLKIESAWAFDNVVGFQQFLKNNKYPISIVALDDKNIEIQLQQASSIFLKILSNKNLSVFKINPQGQLLGTGPYKFKKIGKTEIVLDRNPFYPKQSSGSFDDLHFFLIESEDEVLKNLASHKFDILPLGQDLTTIPSGYKVMEYPSMTTMILMLDPKSPSFKNKDLRCQVIGQLTQSAKDAGYQWKGIEEGLPFSWDIFDKLHYGTKVSQKIKPSKIDLFYSTSNVGFFKNIDRQIEKSFKNKTQIPMSLHRVSHDQMMKGVRSKKISGLLLGISPDYVDPDAFLSPIVKTGQQYNHFKYSNPRLDNLIDEAKMIQNPSQRNAVYQKVFATIANDCVIGLLGTKRQRFLVRENLNFPRISGLGYFAIRLSEFQRMGHVLAEKNQDGDSL